MRMFYAYVPFYNFIILLKRSFPPPLHKKGLLIGSSIKIMSVNFLPLAMGLKPFYNAGFLLYSHLRLNMNTGMPVEHPPNHHHHHQILYY
eukprot:9073006-Ditylum_brightwellii.AAC.1